MFLINQLFKNDSRVIFEDYIASKKFKSDFKAFDKMLQRKIERNSIKRQKNLKSANKILFLVCFLILGISILYGILQPIIFFITNKVINNMDISIFITIISSAVIFIGIAYKYISYINKKQLINNIMSVKVTYILCFIIFGISVLFFNYKDILTLLKNEVIWYKIAITFISSIMTLLYMFNIINQKDKKSYLFYSVIALSILDILLQCNIALSINIVLLSTYSFMIVPGEMNLKDNDYIYKWNCFKKYIEEYSILDQQQENAVLIWEKYLIYAISLGVNKKIIKQYTKLAHINLFNDNYYKKFYIEYIGE